MNTYATKIEFVMDTLRTVVILGFAAVIIAFASTATQYDTSDYREVRSGKTLLIRDNGVCTIVTPTEHGKTSSIVDCNLINL